MGEGRAGRRGAATRLAVLACLAWIAPSTSDQCRTSGGAYEFVVQSSDDLRDALAALEGTSSGNGNGNGHGKWSKQTQNSGVIRLGQPGRYEMPREYELRDTSLCVDAGGLDAQQVRVAVALPGADGSFRLGRLYPTHK
jgi:hypothetical protein